MSYSVLVVDDSPLTRRMIKRSIALSGIDIGSVHEVGNGKDALSVLANNWIDLVLTDLKMPDMNGIEMVEAMARDGLLAKLPVVVVSSSASEPPLARLQELGVRGYLAKPFTPEEIRKAMLDLLPPQGGGKASVRSIAAQFPKP